MKHDLLLVVLLVVCCSWVCSATLVTYPHCGRPLCPANELTAIIPPYECDCKHAHAHADCHCEHHCDCQSGNAHPACGCDSWTQPIVISQPTSAPSLRRHKRRHPEWRPLMVQPIGAAILSAIQKNQCVPNIAGITPGNCRASNSNTECAGGDSNCALANGQQSSNSMSASLSSNSQSASLSQSLSQSVLQSLSQSVSQGQNAYSTPPPPSVAVPNPAAPIIMVTVKRDQQSQQ